MTQHTDSPTRTGRGYWLYSTLLAAIIALITSMYPVRAYAGNDVEADIYALFPSATRLGEKDPKTEVWPVYQLHELLGYAFESIEFAPLKGFSGEPINLLIGLNTQGELSGVKIIHHHEPIFLHGLGPKPLLDFIDQYKNHRISERFIVGKHGTDAGSAYLDGVTKATVSVVVVNDIILSSARQVARQTLQEFAQQSPVAVKTSYFKPMQWQELLSNGLIQVLQVSQGDVEQSLGSELSEFPFEDWQLEHDHATLYIAYLNAPIIGKNILGEAGYQRLKAKLADGEHAVAMMSEGLFSYLESDFQPATSPKRVALNQSNLSIAIRDMNFFSYNPLQLSPNTPDFKDFRIFRISPQTGFNPGGDMEIQLKLNLKKNHLVEKEAIFTEHYQLPETLFDKVETPVGPTIKPTWVTIWENRGLDTLILLVGLLVLTIGFSLQKRWLGYSQHFPWIRWTFLFFTLAFIGIYAQGQLSVVNIFTVLLALRDGFDITVFLLDPIIFILWIFTFASLFIFGRGLFCGWLCPFGAMQEIVAKVAELLKIRQWTVSHSTHRKLTKIKYIILGGLVVTSLVSLRAAEQAAEVEPFKTAVTLAFVREWPFVIYAILILGVGLFINKFYCRYICPLGAGLALLGKFHRLEWLTRRKECGSPCQLCRKKCGVDAIRRDGSIDYDECVQCLECVVILEDPSRCAPKILETKRQHKSPPALTVNLVEAPSAK